MALLIAFMARIAYICSVPPSLSPSRVMQLIKGKSSHRLMRDFRSIRKEFWGRHLWARGYFVRSTGQCDG